MPFKKGNTLGGRRSARNSNIIRTPTPQHASEDEEMVDADAEEEVPVGTPQEEVEEDEGEAATPAQDEEEEEEGESPPRITTIPRRRRGRGGTTRHSSRLEMATPEPGDNEGSESGTPFRRRRGRPPGSGVGSARPRGGFRGRRKGVQPDAARRVIDKDGTALDVVDDEAVVDNDDEGNEKVDSNGNLLGGREYRVRTFTIIGRGDRLYMLSTEPARCCGFRDSYLFFTKHPKLYKVLVNEDEKKDLIDRDILPNSYKGRNIGVVAARSVFREFGARIIVAGRKITDDYKVGEAREHGEVEGELADPHDRIPDDRGEYNRNRYVAWFGASEVYRNIGQSNHAAHAGGKPIVGKRRNNITVQNWQLMHAREASRFNSAATALRRANLDGVYDTHMNMMFYPKIMQPTHARWEHIPPPLDAVSDEQHRKQLTNGLTNGDTMPNGTSHEATHLPSPSQPPSLFSPVPPIISRNFTVIDTAFSGPPLSHTGYPGPDGSIHDRNGFGPGSDGLSGISPELISELPEECRRALEEARKVEADWKKGWGTEKQSALRGDLKVGLNGYPV